MTTHPNQFANAAVKRIRVLALQPKGDVLAHRKVHQRHNDCDADHVPDFLVPDLAHHVPHFLQTHFVPAFRLLNLTAFDLNATGASA